MKALTHRDLVDMIIGGGAPYEEKAEPYVKRGLVSYVGGFDGTWDWVRDELEKLTSDELMEIRRDIEAWRRLRRDIEARRRLKP
jgi:hypothetical protein